MLDKDANGNVLPDNRVTGIYYARANAVNLEPNTITNTVKYEYDDLGRNTSKTVKSTYFILGGEEVEGNEISSENYEYSIEGLTIGITYMYKDGKFEFGCGAGWLGWSVSIDFVELFKLLFGGE